MPDKTPGNEIYQPTSLEWLAITINSILPSPGPYGATVLCIADYNDGKSLLMNVMYSEDTEEKDIDELVDGIKELIMSVAKTYKWDSWIEIDINRIVKKKDSMQDGE